MEKNHPKGCGRPAMGPTPLGLPHLSLSPLSHPLLYPHFRFAIYYTKTDLLWDPLLKVVFKIKKEDQINSNSNHNCFAYESSQDRILFWKEFRAKRKNKKKYKRTYGRIKKVIKGPKGVDVQKVFP